MARHIFIDNSNVYGGAQRAAGTLEPAVLWMSVRVYYKNFFKLIEGNSALTRVLAGSVPPGNDALWQTARDLGYNTDLLKRVEQDDGRLTEQADDEMLHLKIANALLDYEPPQTLVVASGDGRDAQFSTSFPGQVERALKRGWNVEVWSWKQQLTKKYDALCRSYSPRLIVKLLDPYYDCITFVQGGEYTVRNDTIKVKDRIVGRLPTECTPHEDASSVTAT